MPTSFSHRVLPRTMHPSVDWAIQVEGEALGERALSAPDWNYHLGVDIEIELHLDAQEALESLGLGSESRLGLVLSASSAVPGISAVRGELEGQSTHLRLHVPGPSVGGSLRCIATVVVLEAPDPLDDLAPVEPGAVVFRQTRDLTLEGTGARLPLLPISFEEQGLANSNAAMWWLKLLSYDLMMASSDCLWLWINTDSAVMRGVLNLPEAEESKLWRRLLQWDFTRQLLLLAIEDDDLDLGTDYPEQSLGAVLSGVVRLVSDDLSALQAEYANDRGQVEARLQAAVLGLNGEGDHG